MKVNLHLPARQNQLSVAFRILGLAVWFLLTKLANFAQYFNTPTSSHIKFTFDPIKPTWRQLKCNAEVSKCEA